MNKTVTILGRGSSGSRLIASTLQYSGFYVGNQLNESFDKGPYEILYKVAKNFINRIKKLSNDFFHLQHAFHSRTFKDIEMIRLYLKDIFCNPNNLKAWKLPETTFIYPWLTDIFPEIYYIYWVRDPRRNAYHLSNNFLHDAGLFKGFKTEHINFWSWYIQNEIIQQTPTPIRFITIKFEDFVNNQDYELERLSNFLGVELLKLIVDPEKTIYRDYTMPEKVSDTAKKLGYY
jgi:hypothetical protein